MTALSFAPASIFACSLISFSVGIAAGYGHLEQRRGYLEPAEQCRSEIAQVVLDAPLSPRGGVPCDSGLQIALIDSEGSEPVNLVEPPYFDSETPWLRSIVSMKSHGPAGIRATMKGLHYFSGGATRVRIESDNGYRLVIRQASDETVSFDRYEDRIFRDELDVVAKEGWYRVEVDYFNGVGDYFFKWLERSAYSAEFRPSAETSFLPHEQCAAR